MLHREPLERATTPVYVVRVRMCNPVRTNSDRVFEVINPVIFFPSQHGVFERMVGRMMYWARLSDTADTGMNATKDRTVQKKPNVCHVEFVRLAKNDPKILNPHFGFFEQHVVIVHGVLVVRKFGGNHMRAQTLGLAEEHFDFFANLSWCHHVGRFGFEPKTHGLKVHCTARLC